MRRLNLSFEAFSCDKEAYLALVLFNQPNKTTAMRTLYILIAALLMLVLANCSRSTAGVFIPANQEFILGEDSDYAYRARLKNESTFNIRVSVRDKVTGEQTQGFGLAGNGQTDVYISKDEEVHLINETETEGKVTVTLSRNVEGMRYEEVPEGQ
ncbi:MAG: hypothetical protein AAFP08_00470 [Bacteroidota bacterium]